VVKKPSAVKAYQQGFAKAFGVANPITYDHTAEAIAAFERTLITQDRLTTPEGQRLPHSAG
jgi:cytochrome c peroxidase